MSIKYVRKTGSNANSGNSAAAAYLTVQNALNNIVSGDTVYVGAGVYREQLKFTGTTPTGETKVIGDNDGFFTGDAGEVQLTSYLTNDTTAASGTNPTIDLNAKNFFTWQGFTIIGSSLSTASCINAASSVHDVTFRSCTFLNATNVQNRPSISFGAQAADLTANILFDQCLFGPCSANVLSFTVTRSATAEFDSGITVSNCLFLGGGGASAQINFALAGASTGGSPGGGHILNCTFLGGNGGGFASVRVASPWSRTNPVMVVNCIAQTDNNTDVISCQTLGMGWEDGNIVAGPNSGLSSVYFVGSISQHQTYAPLIHIGQDRQWNPLLPRRLGEAPSGAPQLGFSPFSDVSTGVFRTAADDSTVGTVSWTNPSNALIIQELAAQAYATASVNNTDITHYLKLTNLTFSPAIPSGAIITGMRIEINRKAANASDVTWSSIKFFDGTGGGYQTEWVSHVLPTNSAWGTLDVQTQFGTSTDLWGGLTQAKLVNSGSGIGLSITSVGTTTASIDGCRMHVYWKNPTTTSPVDITGRLRPSGGGSVKYTAGAYERQDAATKQSGTIDASTYAGQILGPGTQRFRIPVKNVSTTISIKLRYDSTYDTTVSRPVVRLLESGEIGYAGQSITASTSALNAWETETFTAFTSTADFGVVWMEIQSFDQNGGGKVFFDTETG